MALGVRNDILGLVGNRICRWTRTPYCFGYACVEVEERMTATTTPIAWMVYTLDGKSAFVTDNPADFTQDHRALPLYTQPPQRKPLTDEQLESIEHKAYLATISKGKPMGDYATELMRAIERAHGIGGEE